MGVEGSALERGCSGGPVVVNGAVVIGHSGNDYLHVFI